jgi:uridine phosphorylase
VGRLAIERGVSHIVSRVPPASAHEPIHLKPNAELAPRVLLPGDPHRALAVATDLLDGPKMFNHHRGLWGYTGPAADGELLTVQSTGMGGPSTAIVVEELIALGATTLIRIGTCGAFAGGLRLGDVFAVSSALPDDGASRALGAAGPIAPDAELARSLAEVAGREAGVVSADLFYDARDGRTAQWLDAGAVAVEMECATLFTLSALRGVASGALLAVSDEIAEDRVRIGRERLEEAGLALGRTAYAALSRR